MKVLILFAVATAINVILSTVKSILTIKAGKTVAALANAITYGFYTWVIILTNIDGISLWVKMGITALCNFVGVFIVKLIEEKARKDKLWQVQATVHEPYKESLIFDLKNNNLPFNYIEGVGKYVLFNIYCATQKESKKAKEILDTNKAKYFVSESKVL